MYTYVGRGLGPFLGWLDGLVIRARGAAGHADPAGRRSASTARSCSRATWASTSSTRGSASRSCARLVVWFLTYRGIALSTRTGVVLGLIEIVIFLLDLGPADHQRAAEHAQRLHPGRSGRPAGVPGHGLLPAGVRRLRGRGPARARRRASRGRRSRGRSSGRRSCRAVLRLQLLRGDGLLRAGQDDRVPRLQQRRPVGLHGGRCPAASAACS